MVVPVNIFPSCRWLVGVIPVKPQISATPAMRITAAVMLIVGALLTIGSLFADQLNLTGGGVGLGWKQLIGVVIGLPSVRLHGPRVTSPSSRQRSLPGPQKQRSPCC